MKGTGAIIFLVVFALFVVVTFSYPTLPPGKEIYYAIGAVDIDYPILGIPVSTLVPVVFNGLVYGFIAWLLYTIVSGVSGRGKEPSQTIQQRVTVQVQDKEKEARVEGVKEEVVRAQEAPPQASKAVRISKVENIEGIGPTYAKKLADAGIDTIDDLLEVGATAQGRADLAEKAGISDKLILEWIGMADLTRVKGIGEEYSDLLGAAGVDTVGELARLSPDYLHARLTAVNEAKNLVRRLPTLDEVKQWIAEAKSLPRKIEN